MKIFAATFFLLIFLTVAFAQVNEAQIERELISAVKEMQKNGSYFGSYDDKNLAKAQKNFEDKLLQYTKSASTLRYNFSELSKLIYIADSADGNFRIYSWDTEDGGTMHNFSRIYQFRSADGKVYSKIDELSEEGDPGSFVTDIFDVETKSGTIYIVCSTFIGTTQDHGQSAKLYKIAGNRLVDNVKLIKTKSGLTDSITFAYNFFSVVDREARPVRLIRFDAATKTLKIPIVIETEKFPNGGVTDRFIDYRFNGTYFVKVK